MKLPDSFTFSQSSLQDYVDCPRRFELRYIDGVRYPSLEAQPALEFEEHTRQGARFHTMVQQYFAGVPAEKLSQYVADDEILSTWWKAFIAKGQFEQFDRKHIEITLQTTLGDYRLIAKYDLIGFHPSGDVVIMDWKTSRRIPRKDILKNRMQTKIYRYVLAQAGSYLYNGKSIPVERIQMVYWFVGHDGQTVAFNYSAQDMQSDEMEILKLIEDIESANYFPLTQDIQKCRFCTYRSLCNRGDRAGDFDEFVLDDNIDEHDNFDVDFEQIAEIEF